MVIVGTDGHVYHTQVSACSKENCALNPLLFLCQDLVMKLHHLLQQEADELKRLLGAKSGVVGGQPAAVVEKSTRATLARLKTDLVSRRLHEAGVSTSEVCCQPGIFALGHPCYCMCCASGGTRKTHGLREAHRITKCTCAQQVSRFQHRLLACGRTTAVCIKLCLHCISCSNLHAPRISSKHHNHRNKVGATKTFLLNCYRFL